MGYAVNVVCTYSLYQIPVRGSLYKVRALYVQCGFLVAD